MLVLRLDQAWGLGGKISSQSPIISIVIMITLLTLRSHETDLKIFEIPKFRIDRIQY
jgi:hypothetical protein